MTVKKDPYRKPKVPEPIAGFDGRPVDPVFSKRNGESLRFSRQVPDAQHPAERLDKTEMKKRQNRHQERQLDCAALLAVETDLNQEKSGVSYSEILRKIQWGGDDNFKKRFIALLRTIQILQGVRIGVLSSSLRGSFQSQNRCFLDEAIARLNRLGLILIVERGRKTRYILLPD